MRASPVLREAHRVDIDANRLEYGPAVIGRAVVDDDVLYR
jgi:hypothetical protein